MNWLNRYKFLRSTTAISLFALASLPAMGMDLPLTEKELARRFPVSITPVSKEKGEEQIAIIGGGIAGLTAAYKLNKKGISTCIYEGRDRPGGRIHSDSFKEGHSYEQGATFIDEDQIAVIGLAKELGVNLTKRGFGSRKITVISMEETQKTKTLISELKTLKKALKALNNQIDWNNQILLDKKNNEQRANPLLPFLDNFSPFSKNFIQTYLEDEVGIAIEKISVYAIPELLNLTKDYLELFKYKTSQMVPNAAIDKLAFEYTVVGGTSCLVNSLASKLNSKTIHLNHILTHIEKKDQYLLTFLLPDGKNEIIKADRVIMTLPFSTLRNVNIADSVGLTDLQKKAIQTLPYGTNSKIGIPLSKDIFNDMLYYLNFDEKICGWPGGNSLTLMVNGETGKNLDEKQALPIFKAQCNYIFQNYGAVPNGAPVIKNWSQDPFSLGSYSAISFPGSYSPISTEVDVSLFVPSKIPGLRGMNAFAEPIGNSLFFAGEHTRVDSGFMNSAVESGTTAAKLVIASLPKKTTKKQPKPTKVVL